MFIMINDYVLKNDLWWIYDHNFCSDDNKLRRLGKPIHKSTNSEWATRMIPPPVRDSSNHRTRCMFETTSLRSHYMDFIAYSCLYIVEVSFSAEKQIEVISL